MAETTTDRKILYPHPDCAYSDALKDELDDLGITYDEIDLSKQPDQWTVVEKLAGGERITPVMVTGEVIEVGFHGVG